MNLHPACWKIKHVVLHSLLLQAAEVPSGTWCRSNLCGSFEWSPFLRSLQDLRHVTGTCVPDLADSLDRDANAARYFVNARIRKEGKPKTS